MSKKRKHIHSKAIESMCIESGCFNKTPAGCGCKIVEVLAGDFCEENPPTIEFCPPPPKRRKIVSNAKNCTS